MGNRRLIAWIFSFIPLMITLIVLPMLSDKIPAHFDVSGNVTRYGSKYEMLGLPIVTVLMGFFWTLIGKGTRKDNEKGKQNIKVLFWGDIIMSLIFTVLTIWFLYLAYSHAETINNSGFDFMKVLSVCLCVGWIILGNYLPKCKPNWYIGIRTKWTLTSDTTWYKTHRFGGKVFLTGGIILTIMCLFIFNGAMGLWFSLAGFLIMIIPIIIYSYRVGKLGNSHSLKNPLRR